jgi:AcrR family transcriptional regulator
MARTATKPATPKRPGRRPGENHTRDAILRAARAQFGEHGLEASIRSIAGAAAVDPALVLHFYSSKQQLFEEAMRWPVDVEGAVEQILVGRRTEMGLRMAQFFLSVWEHPSQRDPVIGILRAATTSEAAAQMLRESLGARLFGPIAQQLEVPDATLRLSLCASQLVGLGVARYIVRLEPLASIDAEGAARAVALALQRYLTGKVEVRPPH